MTAFVTPDLVDAIAHSIDIPKLSTEAAKALAPDVEYKLRELIQDAQKFSRHARRLKLTSEDVNNALRMRNAEPLYGFSSKDSAKYVKAAGMADVYAVEDRELKVEQLVEQPLPRPPIEVGVMPHWLFINGVQPLTPENTPLEKPPLKRPRPPAVGLPAAKAAPGAPPGAGSAPGAADVGPASKAAPSPDGQAVQVQPPVQHVLALELQLYFTKALEVIQAALATAGTPTSPQTTQPGPAANGVPQPQQPQAGTSGAAANPPASNGGVTGQAGQPAPPNYWGELPPPASGAPGGGHAGAGAAGSAGAGKAGGGAAVAGGQEDPKLAAVLASLATDPGLHPLCPYLVKFVCDGVTSHLGRVRPLLVLLRLVRALLRNEALGLDAHVHQLLPALLTCVVAKGIGADDGSVPGGVDHGHVRQAAAQLVAEVCARFGAQHPNVQPRVTKTLLKALLDPTKPLTTHYGAVLGLAALGPQAVRMLLLPQLPTYLPRLAPLLPEGMQPSGSPPATNAGTQQQQQQQQQHQQDGVQDGPAAMDVDANGAPPDHLAAAANGSTSSAANGVSGQHGENAAKQQQGAGGGDNGAGPNRGQGRLSAVALDAVRVHGAIVDAVASCLYDLMVAAAAETVPETVVSVTRPSPAVLSKVMETLQQARPQQPGAPRPAALDTDWARAAAVLALAWRDDMGLSDIAWAACELLGPVLQARLPQARPAHAQL